MGKIKDYVNFYETVHKAGYLSDFGDILHEKMSADRIWCTKDGQIIPYTKLSDDHLNRILKMFIEGRFEDTGRKIHFKGLTEEYLRRTTKHGEVLFGTGEEI